MSVKLGLRWFIGQFIVVVAGVLTALAVDSWHSNSRRREAERFYISQLISDLRATEQSLQEASMYNEGSVRSSAALLRAFADPVASPRDSIATWLALVGWATRANLNFSVAEGLVSGDLATIRSDSLRSELVFLLARVERFRRNEDVVWGAFIDYSHRLSDLVPLSERLATMMRTDSLRIARLYHHRPFAPDLSTAFPTDYPELMRDRDAYVVVDGLFDAGTDLTVMQRSFAATVAASRAHLEAGKPESRRR